MTQGQIVCLVFAGLVLLALHLANRRRWTK